MIGLVLLTKGQVAGQIFYRFPWFIYVVVLQLYRVIYLNHSFSVSELAQNRALIHEYLLIYLAHIEETLKITFFVHLFHILAVSVY